MKLKYCILFFLFLISSRAGFSQTVFFDPQIFDFDLIHENNGIVFHEFILDNSTKTNYAVKGIISSCGCTQVDISNDTVFANSFIRVKVGYDPANRPGSFFKQFSLVLKTSVTDSLVVDGFLKGIVLSKNEVLFNPLNYKNAKLEIKSVTYVDADLSKNEKLNDFVNDLTLVIDKDGFVNVNIEYFQSKISDNERAQKLVNIKKEITTALKKRGYQLNPVGFSDTVLIVNGLPASQGFYTVLKVNLYTKSNTQESKIIFNGISMVSGKTIRTDSASIRYSIDIANPQQKINWIEKLPGEFVSHIVRTVLMTGNATIGIYVNGLFASAEESFIKRTLDPQLKNLYTELSEQGIEADKIRILPPVFIKDDVYKMSFNIVEFSTNESLVSWNEFQFHLDSIRKAKEELINYTTEFKNNVPVYYQRVEFQNDFDTSNVQFKEWFNLYKSASNGNKKIKLIVEATASNAPTTRTYDNAFVARRRANNTVINLGLYFGKHGLSYDKNQIKSPYALLKGPLYHEQDFLIQQYKKYQYIKLIPVETDSFATINLKPIPYQVNFSNNDFSIPASGTVFQNFVDHLIPSLKKFGFIEIILESSASKVPATSYNSNRVLAFERLQKAKDAILKAVAEKGYNPLRIIFTEERILVQGPAFKAGMDSKNEVYKQFQYIKIIPKNLINR